MREVYTLELKFKSSYIFISSNLYLPHTYKMIRLKPLFSYELLIKTFFFRTIFSGKEGLLCTSWA